MISVQVGVSSGMGSFISVVHCLPKAFLNMPVPVWAADLNRSLPEPSIPTTADEYGGVVAAISGR